MGVPVNTALQVQLQYTANLQKCLNVLHWVCSVPSTTNGLDNEYSEIFTSLGPGAGNIDVITRFRNCLSGSVTLNRVRAQFVWPIRYRHNDLVIVGGVGTRPGDCLAQNLQASITKKGDIADERGIGAMRIGGLSSLDYSAGALSPGLKVLMDLLAVGISSPFTTAGGGFWEPLIWGNQPPNANSPGRKITLSFAQPEVRTQRTRTVGRGD